MLRIRRATQTLPAITLRAKALSSFRRRRKGRLNYHFQVPIDQNGKKDDLTSRVFCGGQIRRYYVARIAFEFDSESDQEAEDFLQDITEMIRHDRERRQQYLNNYTIELSSVSYEEYRSLLDQVKKGVREGVKKGLNLR